MDTIVIKRSNTDSTAKATFGAITVNGKKAGVTLEPGIGVRISTGTYAAGTYNSPKFKRKVILLKAVPGRSYIEIHAGNSTADTTGCILVGSEKVGNRIHNSIKTLEGILLKIKTPSNIQVIVK